MDLAVILCYTGLLQRDLDMPYVTELVMGKIFRFRNQSRKCPARERRSERDSGSVRHACRGLGCPREADGGVSCGSRRIVLFGDCV